MALNSAGTQKYDNRGTAEGFLLTANDAGTQKYDNKGTAEGAIGTGGGLRLLASLGVGI